MKALLPLACLMADTKYPIHGLAPPPAQIDGWGIRYRDLGAALLSPFRHLSLINTNSSPHRLNISPSGGLVRRRGGSLTGVGQGPQAAATPNPAHTSLASRGLLLLSEGWPKVF